MKFFIKKFTLFLLVSAFLNAEQDLVKSSRCKKFQNLNVCNSLNVGGNETVEGSVTANSFISPSGVLFTGVRNYAVLSNQTEVLSGDNFLWAATPASNLSSGITFDPSTGLITLPTGIFLIKYTARLNIEVSPDSTATVQLQQTVNGTPTNISQAAITNDLEIDGFTDIYPDEQSQIVGYALIQVTSSANNAINLVFTLAGSNIFIPAASGTDANAQIAILQLN